MRNEKSTRKEIIDQRLKQAGWNVTDPTQVIEEFNIHLTVVDDPQTPYAGHQYSDYVLLACIIPNAAQGCKQRCFFYF